MFYDNIKNIKSKKIFLISAILFVSFITLYILTKSSTSNFQNLEFSDYYQNAPGFDEIEDSLKDYFNYVQKAYNKSDKQKISTFVLPYEFYETQSYINETIERREEFEVLKTIDFDDYDKWLSLIKPYIEMNEILSFAVNESSLVRYSGSEAKLYDDIENNLNNTYKEYKKGEGLSKEELEKIFIDLHNS